jgi:hypothetical protein
MSSGSVDFRSVDGSTTLITGSCTDSLILALVVVEISGDGYLALTLWKTSKETAEGLAREAGVLGQGQVMET